MAARPRGLALLQDAWLLEELAHVDREMIPEWRLHAKGSGAYPCLCAASLPHGVACCRLPYAWIAGALRVQASGEPQR